MRIELLDEHGEVENIVVGDPEWAEAAHPGRWREEPSAEVPEPLLPAIVLTDIVVDEANAARARIAQDLSWMKLPVGALVTITAELQMGGQRLAGFAGDFAMPMRSTDGFFRHIDVVFVDGIATFTATMLDSKHWQVTEELVNSKLPAAEHMRFAGIDITVVE